MGEMTREGIERYGRVRQDRLMVNCNWTGPKAYTWWAKYLDPDYDPKDDISPSRLYVAWLVGDTNLAVAVDAMLNVGGRKDLPEAWDECMAFLVGRGWPEGRAKDNIFKFEEAAKSLLLDMGQRYRDAIKLVAFSNQRRMIPWWHRKDLLGTETPEERAAREKESEACDGEGPTKETNVEVEEE